MDISGTCEIIDNDLKFTAKLAGIVRMKDWDFTIPLKAIIEIKYITLNLIMPIDVYITLDDGKEYMFGSLNRKVLNQMLEMNVMEINQRH